MLKQINTGNKNAFKINSAKICTPACCFFLLFAICSSVVATAKELPHNKFRNLFEKEITGTVTDENSVPLNGANITIKGTEKGFITDATGKFKISVPGPQSVLVVSYVGYKTLEVLVGDNNNLSIKLQVTKTNDLADVVVVGYGTQKKTTLTGSVVTVKGTALQKSPAANLSNSLVGRLPGLVAVNNGGGRPGDDGATLQIRGSNTFGQSNAPLIVVDGIANRDFERISPAEIESISVLKDASAAIYGAQAANGVILITTKRGQKGKPKITLSTNFGSTQSTVIPKMLNSTEYATVANELAGYAGQPAVFSNDDIQKYADGSDPWGHPSTNLFNEVLKPWTSQQYTNAGISGGTENMRYFLSFGARTQKSVYKKSDEGYRQYDFRANIDSKISPSIDVSFDAYGRQENRVYANQGADAIWNALQTVKPTVRVYWPNGTPASGLSPSYGSNTNPAVAVTDAGGYNKSTIYTFQSNLRLNVLIPWVKGLSVQGNASFDKGFNFSKIFQKPYTLYTWDGNTNYTTTPVNNSSVINLGQTSDVSQKVTFNLIGNYEKTIGKNNNIKLTAGTERQSGDYAQLYGFRANYASTQIDQLFAGANDVQKDADGYGTQFARLNYFGRLNYNYAQKYLMEFVFRYDGSYKFAPGKQFGFFPGVSAGWRISEEKFWKNNIKFIDNFKLRASIGKTGNDGIAGYQYLATYGFFPDSYTLNNAERLIMVESRTPNPDVTWETAIQKNIGFDALLLKGGLSVSFDYFYNKRSDILTSRVSSVPSSAGLILPPENIGKMDNRGFEYSISYSNNARELKYTVSLNGSYSKNKIIFWDDVPNIPDYQKKAGKPLGSDLYYNAIGIFKDQGAVDKYPHFANARPGDIIYEDINKDGEINSDDLVRSKTSADPRYIGGFSIDLQYKRFDVSILFQGAAGGQGYYLQESGSFANFLKEDYDGRWNENNINAAKPRAYNWSQDYWARSDYKNQNSFWLRNNDYLRLKNVELGYNLPERICKRIGIASVRFYANGFNLITWSAVKRTDPELPSNRAYIYPVQRIINTGLVITF